MARRMANGGRAPFDANRQRLRVRRRGAACEKRTERGFQELSKALPTDPAFNFDGGLRTSAETPEDGSADGERRSRAVRCESTTPAREEARRGV